MDVIEVQQELYKESAVVTKRKPIVLAVKNNGMDTPRQCQTREGSSRYRSPTPTNSRRCPSPNHTRNVNPALSSLASKRAVSAERKRPSTPPSPQPSTPVSETSAESQLLANKVIGSKLPELLWPSTMRILSVSFQSDSISIPVVKKKEKEKPVTQHGNPDRTLRPTSNVAQKQVEFGASRKPTPERKRSPLKGKNSSHQSENSRPVDISQSKLIDQHRWPSRTGGRLSSNVITPRRLSVEGNPRPLQKSSSNFSEQSECDYHNDALGLRMKAVDNSLLRMPAIHKAANGLSLSEKSTSAIPNSSVRLGSLPGSSLPSPSRVSISRASPSPSKTRPCTPTQSRGASPSRIRPSSPTRVLSFIADIKKGKKNNQLEEVHQLRLLYNRHLQWRFANAQAEAALYIQKIIAQVRIFSIR